MIGTFSLGPSPSSSPFLLATGGGEGGGTLGRKELGATEKPNLVPRIQGLPMPTTMDTLQDLEQQERPVFCLQSPPWSFLQA